MDRVGRRSGEGAISDAHLLGELGAVLNGKVQGRLSNQDVTVYESLGIAIEDLAAAHAVHQRALATGKGAWFEWSGSLASA